MIHSNRIAGWFAALLNKHSVQELKNLQAQIRDLELRVRRIQDTGGQAATPIVVEQIRIDQVVVEKIEYNNNFGALGIKELSGQLNIGANYTIARSDSVLEEEDLRVFKEMHSNAGQAREQEEPGTRIFDSESLYKTKKGRCPKVNIKTKPSNFS